MLLGIQGKVVVSASVWLQLSVVTTVAPVMAVREKAARKHPVVWARPSFSVCPPYVQTSDP